MGDVANILPRTGLPFSCEKRMIALWLKQPLYWSPSKRAGEIHHLDAGPVVVQVDNPGPHRTSVPSGRRLAEPCGRHILVTG